MDRGAWQATVHGVVSVRHDLATKPPRTEEQRKRAVFSETHEIPQPLFLP